MKHYISHLVLSLVLLSTAVSLPLPKTDPVDISGKIKGFVWISGFTFKCEDDILWLSEGSEPPKYYVLIETESLTSSDRKSLSVEVSSRIHFTHPMLSNKRKKREILVRIESPQNPLMKKGAKIEVKGYSIEGSDFVIRSSFAEVSVDGKALKHSAKGQTEKEKSSEIEDDSLDKLGKEKIKGDSKK